MKWLSLLKSTIICLKSQFIQAVDATSNARVLIMVNYILILQKSIWGMAPKHKLSNNRKLVPLTLFKNKQLVR